MRSLLIILSFLASMLIPSVPASAESPEICLNKAKAVYFMATLRDREMTQEQVVSRILDYEENKEEIDQILKDIYVDNPQTSSENLTVNYYNTCLLRERI